jgi:general secretion pathway protein G
MKERLLEARRRHSNEDGFTLIELLIVIVILGVLAAIVVFSVSGITDRGNESACQSDVATVTTAGEAYYAKNGSYAADMNALVPGFMHSVPGDVDYSVTVAGGKDVGFVAKGAAGSDCAGYEV